MPKIILDKLYYINTIFDLKLWADFLCISYNDIPKNKQFKKNLYKKLKEISKKRKLLREYKIN